MQARFLCAIRRARARARRTLLEAISSTIEVGFARKARCHTQKSALVNTIVNDLKRIRLASGSDTLPREKPSFRL